MCHDIKIVVTAEIGERLAQRLDRLLNLYEQAEAAKIRAIGDSITSKSKDLRDALKESGS